MSSCPGQSELVIFGLTGFDFQMYEKCEKIPAKKVLKWRK